jgi:cell wall-associated NlpC family hydrolase
VSARNGRRGRRVVMGVLAVVVGVGGIAVGLVRGDQVRLLPQAPSAAASSLSGTPVSDLRFQRREEPARTTVVDAAGTVLATFTDGARTVTLDGPERTFTEPQFPGRAVTTRVWVRLLPEQWNPEDENAPWVRDWLRTHLGSTEPDVLAFAKDYLDGAPEERDGKEVRFKGDASFGPPPPPGRPPIENNDFYDYLGVDWTFADGARREPDPVRYGTVDCSGFVRLVYGFRAGYPLIPTNERGPGLPRRARAMSEVGPGVTLLPDTGGIPTNLGVLQAGDLLFFDLDKTVDGRTDHVAIYLGRDESGGHRFVSSRVRADGPTLGDLGGTSLLDDGGYYSRSLRSAKRL